MIRLTRADAHDTKFYVNPETIAQVEVARSHAHPNAASIITFVGAPLAHVQESAASIAAAVGKVVEPRADAA